MAPETGQHRGEDGADSVTDRARVRYLAGDAESRDTVAGADLAELDDLRTMLADPTLWAEPPASLEESVVALIGAEAAQRPAAGSTATDDPAAVPAPTDLAAARTAKATRAERRPVWRRPALLVAAAVAVVAVAFSAVLLLQNTSAQPRFDVALAATDLAPGASGTADMVRTDSGWRITLHATGLPRLDGGDFYQAWLRNADGVLVPIGTFNEGTDVTLWAGVSPKDFRTMTITRESADGVQDSSGQRVLAGDVRPE
jgi:anti-sigma-K factor RskA